MGITKANKGFVGIIELFAFFILIVIPSDRLGSSSAAIVDRTIFTSIDTKIISEFTKLPKHFGTGYSKKESS